MRLLVIFGTCPEGLEAGVARLVGTEASSMLSAVQQLVADPQAYHRVANLGHFELLRSQE